MHTYIRTLLQDNNIEYNMQNSSSSHMTENASSKTLLFAAPGYRSNCYVGVVSLSNESPQVTKYQPAQASHILLTHRTDRPHSGNAFDSQLKVQHHRDSTISHQGIESLLRLNPVSPQQRSIVLLLQHKQRACHYSTTFLHNIH